MSLNKPSRRKFLASSVQTGIALTVGSFTGLSYLESCSPAKRVIGKPALLTQVLVSSRFLYSFTALEPYIDAKTMELHFTKHAATYLTNLNEAAKGESVDTSKTVEELLAIISKYSVKMRNNGGGHFNHELFWKCMKPKGEGKPSGQLLTAIEANFKSFDDFKSQFSEAGRNRFGSGWVWLYADNTKKLKIGSTPNQDNPLMDVAEFKGMPLLGLDVWEHAYYLKYQNKRADYIDSWWNLVNWEFVQSRFEQV